MLVGGGRVRCSAAYGLLVRGARVVNPVQFEVESTRQLSDRVADFDTVRAVPLAALNRITGEVEVVTKSGKVMHGTIDLTALGHVRSYLRLPRQPPAPPFQWAGDGTCRGADRRHAGRARPRIGQAGARARPAGWRRRS
jgi:hypothetical protein